jgi:hypothetical protein
MLFFQESIVLILGFFLLDCRNASYSSLSLLESSFSAFKDGISVFESF